MYVRLLKHATTNHEKLCALEKVSSELEGALDVSAMNATHSAIFRRVGFGELDGKDTSRTMLTFS